MTELRTGIIGVAGQGAEYLGELGRNERFSIKAIADRNMELAKEYALQYDAAAYDDFRSLIVQEKLDVLFLLLPNHLGCDFIAPAARYGMHVFKLAPLARTLPEGVQIVETMEKANLKLQVAASRRFAPGFRQGREILQEGRLGDVYLIRAESFLDFPATGVDFDWRGDPLLAGGGVLLEQTYYLIDQIVWNFGPPETLYALSSDKCSKRVLPPSRTEDSVIVVMRFDNGVMGNVVSSWMTGPERERLIIHGTSGSMEISKNRLLLFEPDGSISKQQDYQISKAALISEQINHFADTILDSETKPLNCGKSHLANVAVIESAYLSVRTQLPESLRVYGSRFNI